MVPSSTWWLWPVKLGLVATAVGTGGWCQSGQPGHRSDARSRVALENLRQLARGLYPPLPETQGLLPALMAQARRAPLPVEVNGADRRFPREVEGAVHFAARRRFKTWPNTPWRAEPGSRWRRVRVSCA